MNRPDRHFQDMAAHRYDPAGARSWMADVCGPHALDVRQPGRLDFQHHGNVLKSLSTVVGQVQYGTDVTIGISAETNLNCYSLSLPLTGEQELAKQGRLLRSDRTHGVIISPHEQQELTIAGDCRKLQVAIARASINQVLEQLLQRPLDAPLCFEPVMDAVEGASASWWRMVSHLNDELSLCRDLYDQVFFGRDIESALIKGLLLAQPNNYSGELRQRLQVKLPHYVQAARAFIEANAQSPICLEDIERACGIPRSKLFEVFRKYLGLSPMAYLKKYRLNCVRQVLLEQPGVRNISAVAMDWGFTHLGRFASEYRKQFGEAPSATLQRQEGRGSQL
nr:AraC family transcriptional regulator [Pseudomonas akapageensis]